MILRGIMKRAGVVREDDIQAYADGWLEGARLRQVEQHLLTCPEDAERVVEYRRINAGLASLGRLAQDSEIPDPLTAMVGDLRDALVCQRRVRRTVAGAVGSVLLLGTSSGVWMLSGSGPGPSEPTFEVATVAQPDGGTMLVGGFPDDFAEIKAASETEVINWLSERVDTESFAMPDLNSAGFKLSGARVLPTPEGPLVQILYRDDAEAPLTLSVSVGDVPRNRAGSGGLEDRQMAVYWRHGPLVYSLMGPMRYSDLATLTDIVGQQTGRPSVPTPPETNTASAIPGKAGVVLVESTTEAPSGTDSAGPATADTSTSTGEAAKSSDTIAKGEEPKPL